MEGRLTIFLLDSIVSGMVDRVHKSTVGVTVI